MEAWLIFLRGNEVICFKFYRKSCARTELKTVKDNLPSQDLRGKPLAFDHRLCPGTREFEPLPGWGGEFELECQAAV